MIKTKKNTAPPVAKTAKIDNIFIIAFKPPQTKPSPHHYKNPYDKNITSHQKYYSAPKPCFC